MTIEEIFTKLITQKIEGLMYHDEFSKIYEFLNLYGYAELHRYQYIKEAEEYQKLTHYYSSTYYKLPIRDNITQPKIIPDNWYKYNTMAIDIGAKRNAIRELMNKWVEWEKSTKKLYQEMRNQLYVMGEVATALFLDEYIIDVTEELKFAEKKLLQLEDIGYDMSVIVPNQEDLYKKYKKKLRW